MKDQKINISFDVEDIYGDQKLLNNTLFDLLNFCEENKIYVDVYISAIKIPYLSPDIINLLQKSKYITPGYHSNSHSFITIPEQNSMKELKESEEHIFDINNEELTEEKGGIYTYLKYFSPTIFRCPGYCWTPDYFEFMQEYGFSSTTIDIDYDDAFSYKGITVIPTLIKALEKITDFEDIDFNLQNYSIKSVYLHPARLIYDHFWDKMKNNSYHIVTDRNVYPNMKDRINLIKDLFLYLKNNYSLFSAASAKFQNKQQEPDDLNLLKSKLQESMVSKWGWSQILKPVDKNYHLSKLETSTLFMGKIEV